MEVDESYKELHAKNKANLPLKAIEEKWKLVPAFLRLRGLVKQHIDSFNYFINVEIKKIVQANSLITMNDDRMGGGGLSGGEDPADRFFFKFTDIRVGMPVIKEDCVTSKIMP
mmetsp:Transcript_8355/g.10179  ORF Transcript_8355/g.10179 Transcript_8355/m.10179 type:complete len:113 (+) Transcript_8355:64-402(+)